MAQFGTTFIKMNGFFQDDKGNKSSSRLNSSIVIWSALVMAEQVLLFAYLMRSDILLAASAAGTTFMTIASPAMYFMFKQKTQESQTPNT